MKRIVISGSMCFLDEMEMYAELLIQNGYHPIVPESDDWSQINEASVHEYKRKVSRKHFDEIAHEDTYGVLVVNQEKRGKKNYIGANTFAEIAIAFYFGKKVFLLYDVYEPYFDELLAWGCVPLKGDINLI